MTPKREGIGNYLLERPIQHDAVPETFQDKNRTTVWRHLFDRTVAMPLGA